VIEEGDRISARFTYNGTFSKAFTGYQPNTTAVQMRMGYIAREGWEADRALGRIESTGSFPANRRGDR
jgi:hypothetical protein